MIPWQPILLAFSNRCRGGLIRLKSGQLGRFLFWAIPFALSVFFVHHPNDMKDVFYYAGMLLFAAFGGSCWVAWGPYANMTQASDFRNMAVEGLKFTSPIAIVALWGSIALSVFLLISGLFVAPSYCIASKIPSRIPGIHQGPELGEFITGLSIGIFIFLYGAIFD